ncbi:MAG: general secretion pathway protein GspK [Deltaproteobacteria bacterium]|nr:general secretion pathway protein GspK [Deltaproteobacteria bacterium]MBW2050532.1 general secretion pathway protein GspK [Deltaproteobacteria bacterium]
MVLVIWDFDSGMNGCPFLRLMRSKSGVKNEKGIALFLVLWVLTLLSVIVGEFCYSMRTEVNITRNFKIQTEAYYIALAGLNRAVGEIMKGVLAPGGPPEEIFPGEEEEEEVSPWRVNTHIPAVVFGSGEFRVSIGNESGKIDLNRANRETLIMLLKGFDLDPSEEDVIADSILDWRDPNNLHRVNGAEDDYYQSLPEPYECKDADFDTVEELLMVRGVTPDIFYGGLRDMVTAHRVEKSSRRTRRSKSNTGKINLNAASEKMLLTLPLITEELVQEIVEYRKESDFESLTDVASVVGPQVFQAISPFITLEMSPYYTVVSEGRVEGSRIRRGMEVFVEIGSGLEKGYRVLEWRDRLPRPAAKPPSDGDRDVAP